MACRSIRAENSEIVLERVARSGRERQSMISSHSSLGKLRRLDTGIFVKE